MYIGASIKLDLGCRAVKPPVQALCAYVGSMMCVSCGYSTTNHHPCGWSHHLDPMIAQQSIIIHLIALFHETPSSFSSSSHSHWIQWLWLWWFAGAWKPMTLAFQRREIEASIFLPRPGSPIKSMIICSRLNVSIFFSNRTVTNRGAQGPLMSGEISLAKKLAKIGGPRLHNDIIINHWSFHQEKKSMMMIHFQFDECLWDLKRDTQRAIGFALSSVLISSANWMDGRLHHHQKERLHNVTQCFNSKAHTLTTKRVKI